jgi:hypothetical protein
MAAMRKGSFIHGEKILKEIFGEEIEKGCDKLLPCGCCEACGCVCHLLDEDEEDEQGS